MFLNISRKYLSNQPTTPPLRGGGPTWGVSKQMKGCRYRDSRLLHPLIFGVCNDKIILMVLFFLFFGWGEVL